MTPMQIKLTIFIMFFGLVLCSTCFSERSIDQIPDIEKSATSFLEDLVIHRDAEKALSFLSEKFILGKCMLPDKVVGENPNSFQRQIATEFFYIIANKLSEHSNIQDVISCVNGIPPRLNSVTYKDCYSLCKASLSDDNEYYLICKLDQSERFRKALRDKNIVYQIFNIRLGNSASDILGLTFAWKYEGKSREWKIISFGVVEQ